MTVLMLFSNEKISIKRIFSPKKSSVPTENIIWESSSSFWKSDNEQDKKGINKY